MDDLLSAVEVVEENLIFFYCKASEKSAIRRSKTSALLSGRAAAHQH